MPVPYWRLSGFYLFYFATLGSFLPYWSLYLKNVGFNAAEIGELSALLSGTKIVAPNLWGWIADHSGKSLHVIRIAAFFSALLFAGFFFITDYWQFAWVTVGFSFFWNAALPQFEAVTLFHLRDESHRYSQIRLWGSIGFIVSVFAIGRLLDDTDIDILPVIIISLLTAIWLTTLLTPDAKPMHFGISGGLFKVLKRSEVIAFFIVYMLLQTAHGPYYVFYSVFLKQNHYSGMLTGLLWSVGVGAEIVLFVFMRKLLRYVSLRHVLLSAVVLGIVRWLLIAWCADYPPVLFGAQLLHAATFGASHVAAIHLVDGYFGHGHQGKGQALYSSLSFGLGGMLGGLGSGYLWDSVGPEIVFTLASGCCCLAFIIAYAWIGRGHANKAAMG
ncbi:MAG: MFS transporter [Gammaproteobacteria bacterium]